MDEMRSRFSAKITQHLAAEDEISVAEAIAQVAAATDAEFLRLAMGHLLSDRELIAVARLVPMTLWATWKDLVHEWYGRYEGEWLLVEAGGAYESR